MFDASASAATVWNYFRKSSGRSPACEDWRVGRAIAPGRRTRDAPLRTPPKKRASRNGDGMGTRGTRRGDERSNVRSTGCREVDKGRTWADNGKGYGSPARDRERTGGVRPPSVRRDRE